MTFGYSTIEPSFFHTVRFTGSGKVSRCLAVERWIYGRVVFICVRDSKERSVCSTVLLHSPTEGNAQTEIVGIKIRLLSVGKFLFEQL